MNDTFTNVAHNQLSPNKRKTHFLVISYLVGNYFALF